MIFPAQEPDLGGLGADLKLTISPLDRPFGFLGMTFPVQEPDLAGLWTYLMLTFSPPELTFGFWGMIFLAWNLIWIGQRPAGSSLSHP